MIACGLKTYLLAAWHLPYEVRLLLLPPSPPRFASDSMACPLKRPSHGACMNARGAWSVGGGATPARRCVDGRWRGRWADGAPPVTEGPLCAWPAGRDLAERARTGCAWPAGGLGTPCGYACSHAKKFLWACPAYRELGADPRGIRVALQPPPACRCKGAAAGQWPSSHEPWRAQRQAFQTRAPTAGRIYL